MRQAKKPDTIYPVRKTLHTCPQQAGEPGKTVRGHRGSRKRFTEDECRKRKRNSSENFAIMRQIALNLLNQEKTVMKAGVNAKRLRAGWNNKYLLTLLNI